MSLVLVFQAASSTPESVVSTVNHFTNFLLAYVAALGAVGALSMALVEAWKKLFDSRTRFQALRWTQWLQRTPLYLGIGNGEDESSARRRAYSELLQLCTGVPAADAQADSSQLLESGGHLPFYHAFIRWRFPSRAVFALELERMMGNIQEAADVALASPRQNTGLYLLMTTGADPDDIRNWYQKGPESLVAIVDPTSEDRQRIKDHADRFARLRQVTKRKLDGFQIYAADRWASWNQIWANVVGMIALFLILVWLKTRPGAVSPPGYPTIVIFSLLGGILSPLAKDLVSALKRVKDG
jgi:hypothetical protein